MTNQLKYKGPCIPLKLHKMLHAQNEVERERGRGRAGAHTFDSRVYRSLIFMIHTLYSKTFQHSQDHVIKMAPRVVLPFDSLCPEQSHSNAPETWSMNINESCGRN